MPEEDKIDFRKARKPEVNIPLPPKKKESLFKAILGSKATILFLLGVCIVLLIVSSAFLGAYHSCNKGGGKLLSGFVCADYEVLGACNIGEKVYKLPADYYKILYPDGSLSEENYTLRSDGTFIQE